MAAPIVPPPNDPFWLKFDARIWHGPETSCAIWTAGRDKDGYGKIYLRGRSEKAHRLAFLRGGGVFTPDKPFALHACDNPACVEFRHLFAGDHAENQADKARRNRGTKSRRGWPFGVRPSGRGFRARIRAGGESRHLGTFDSWAVASATAFYERNLFLNPNTESEG